jgi:hypothetical protein
MDSILDLSHQNGRRAERVFCEERHSLLFRYAEAALAVNRELTNELRLATSERPQALAVLREKERARTELHFHERSHGCGVRPIALAGRVRDRGAKPASTDGPRRSAARPGEQRPPTLIQLGPGQ